MADTDPASTTTEKEPGSLAQEPTKSLSTENVPPTPLADHELSSSTAGLSLQPESPQRDGGFSDPTPRTPPLPSPSQSSAAEKGQGFDEKDDENMSRLQAKSPQKLDLQGISEQKPSEPLEKDLISSPEIKHIMDQFEQSVSDPVDTTNEPAQAKPPGSLTGAEIRHPPRSSSLEPIKVSAAAPDASHHEEYRATPGPSHFSASPSESPLNPAFARSEKQSVAPMSSPNSTSNPRQSHAATPLSGRPPSLNKALPPEPDPEPDLPFDFHRFLEQLRHRSADPVAKFLRSFLVEFSKKQWMAHEQTKIISDFLAFITNKMAQCEVWQGVSDAEFDNAREGMEKLVMNRLYTQTFSPAIPPPSADRGKRRQGERGPGPGRRGQHQEDVERDAILSQKIQIYQWVREEHLDLKPVSDSGRRFLTLAQQELSKIKSYRAPRDKVICVLNCCKVIFGLLRNAKSDQSADSFVPLLIYVVLKANPEHLVSNVQYILRFRSQEKLGGEAGYYLSSLMGVIQFIETLDRTSLTISDEDFEKQVEASVSVITEKQKQQEQQERQERSERSEHARHMHIAEKSLPSQPEVTPRNSMEGEWASPRRATASRDGTDTSTTTGDDQAAVAGLLRTIQKPLSTIGRIFSEESSRQGSPRGSPSSSTTPQPQDGRGRSPARYQQDARASTDSNKATRTDHDRQRGDARTRPAAEDEAARQASAETAEAQRIQRLEHRNVVETLSGMFPDLDKEVIDDVVREKEGRVGLAVDACLALSS